MTKWEDNEINLLKTYKKENNTWNEIKVKLDRRSISSIKNKWYKINKSNREFKDNILNKNNMDNKKKIEDGYETPDEERDIPKINYSELYNENNIIKCQYFIKKFLRQRKNVFKINEFLNFEDLEKYVNCLKKYKNKTIKELLDYAYSICPQLPNEKQVKIFFKNSKTTDKGLTGKIIEYGLFGNKPNSNSNPDLNEIDIKVTNFKTLKNKNLNAKERLTLTNCGDTNDYDSFENIVNNSDLKKCKYYPKIKNGLLFIIENDKIKNKTLNQIFNQKFKYCLLYNIETLPYFDEINNDYIKIRERVLNTNVSQRGQKFLHIHPHGSGHGSGTRAFGYTNRFITTLVAYNISNDLNISINQVLIKKGRSISINKEYL